ncbi:MAG TPA: TonB-dependent receptor [Gammaproteobacteria bacterium]|nr:TonB-dependent receptor [Gammaproteobacteria bacterium]
MLPRFAVAVTALCLVTQALSQTTARDGGSAANAGAVSRPTARDGGSAPVAGASLGPADPDTIDVIGVTPLGSGIDANRLPSNAQTATAEQIREQGALDLSDFMRRNLSSVFVNEAQSNPLQPDLQFRGFVGSPVLGLPQGLAVYQDGVRINEPFGDTVNWALIPESAIDRVTLLPGASPLFGLNALGGAIAIDTKNGFTNPGTRAEILAGSFGRVEAQVETGGAMSDRLSWFVTASHFDEDGWRDYSPSRANQLFANLGLVDDTSTVDVSLTYADTDLIGNGAAPEDLLEIDRGAIFTRPDQTRNELVMFAVTGSSKLSDTLSLTGNLYVRSSDIRTLNGDNSDFAECENTPGFLCEGGNGGEQVLLDENGDAIEENDELEGATLNRSSTKQNTGGFGLQAAWHTGRGEIALGLAHDRSEVEFASSTELGSLDATRFAVPGGVFVGDALTGLDASTDNTGVYATATFGLTDALTLTLSGRYNRTEVDLEDHLGDELNGNHTFERFNPAIGLTAKLGGDLAFYASYSEANRAPSPVELTCADEGDPCRLPNAFVADPPLKQVVAKTFEAGFRGGWSGGRWHAGLFHTVNEDDILFVSAGELTNEGFFDNVGETRRQGLELSLAGEGERLQWFVNYTALDATFREEFEVASPNNPAADDGVIPVEPGDRLPLVPKSLLKGGMSVALGERLRLGGDVIASSGAPFRGDEGNLVEELDGYALLNLRLQYRLGAHAEVFLNLDNVLDEQYATFGVFGNAKDVLGDDFDAPQFVSPGSPRAAWLGVRMQF